ncbi:FAD-dependent monooxygenase [Fusarium beomiforme]|uniref:FAD-dependent monooxygenase n=1 Tax=Fusarium beomiforme TaxID=44412 RepID=A0A9P5A3V0_9HYPO|nr:FAD-dependent monooxygenase [Fusarium beomiforme]
MLAIRAPENGSACRGVSRVSEEAVYTILGGAHGPFKIEIDNILVRSTYRPRTAVAKPFSGRQLRVFLAGDAAHQNIPTGGYGMNTGIGDAYDIAWKLAAVVNRYGGSGLLASYEQERRPVAARDVKRAAGHISVHLGAVELLGTNPSEVNNSSDRVWPTQHFPLPCTFLTSRALTHQWITFRSMAMNIFHEQFDGVDGVVKAVRHIVDYVHSSFPTSFTDAQLSSDSDMALCVSLAKDWSLSSGRPLNAEDFISYLETLFQQASQVELPVSPVETKDGKHKETSQALTYGEAATAEEHIVFDLMCSDQSSPDWDMDVAETGVLFGFNETLRTSVPSDYEQDWEAEGDLEKGLNKDLENCGELNFNNPTL